MPRQSDPADDGARNRPAAPSAMASGATRPGASRAFGTMGSGAWFGSLACALASAALAAWALGAPLTPAARPADCAPTEVSAARAHGWLERLCARPHPTGTAANAAVRAEIVEGLRAMGIEVEEQSWSVPGADGTVGGSVAGVNVLARLPGADDRAHEAALLFVCHYDARPGPGGGADGGAPGAGDDGAAVAAFLETLRALRAAAPLANELRFLFTDGEELGLLGARAFAERPGALEGVVGVLNFEGRGNAGPAILFQTAGADGPWLQAFARHARHPVATSLGPAVYERLPNDTDFSVFAARGLPGLNFAFVGGGSAYHQPFDSPANLSPRSAQHHAELVLDLARGLGGDDLRSLTGSGGRGRVFTLPGNLLVHYPAGLDVPLVLGAAVLVGGALLGALRQRRLRVSGLLLALLAWPVGVALLALGSAGPALGLAKVSGALRATLLSEAASPRGNGASADALAVATCAWGAAVLALTARRARPAWVDTALAGSLLALAIAAIAALAMMPGASHVLAVPLACGGGILACAGRIPPGMARLAPANGASMVLPATADDAWRIRLALAQLGATTALCGLFLAPHAILLGQVGSVHPLGPSLVVAPLVGALGGCFAPWVAWLVRAHPRGVPALALAAASAASLRAGWLAAAGL